MRPTRTPHPHGDRELRQIGDGSIRRQDFLRFGSEFAYVRTHGKSFAMRRLVLGYVPAPDGQTRLGMIVTRRFDRRAVGRNRARRLMREAYRLVRHGITQPVWLVTIARQHAHDATMQEMQDDLLRALRKADLFESGSGS